jgi:hypothetical protein
MPVTHSPAKENEFLEPILLHVELGFEGGSYPYYLSVLAILIDIDDIRPKIRTIHPLLAFLAHTNSAIHSSTPPRK